jgi:hypothetical protein
MTDTITPRSPTMTLAQLADRWQTLTLAAVEAVVGQPEPEPQPEPAIVDPWHGILPEFDR